MAKYKLLINDDSFHDSDVALIDDEKIICVLETERISKHKHAMYEKADACADYVKKQYNLKDEEVEIIKNIIESTAYEVSDCFYSFGQNCRYQDLRLLQIYKNNFIF